ncbi:hypothetical protein [Nocardia sp. NPDC057440]|uniref:hypothetical protein n=1 Tax=Nocardia sp. NPDC057440 TaxID=3346134 RepID=UPI0036704A19
MSFKNNKAYFEQFKAALNGDDDTGRDDLVSRAVVRRGLDVTLREMLGAKNELKEVIEKGLNSPEPESEDEENQPPAIALNDSETLARRALGQ